MMDITELQRRITAALDRIGAGVDVLERPVAAPDPAPQDDGPSAAEVQAELEAERELTAQLEERVRAIKARQDGRVTQLENDLETARRVVAELEEDRARLKRVNAALRETSQALREANAAGLADADLVNGALRGELEALTAARDSDRAEMEQILGALAPLVDGGEERGANA
ncbi:hypothetical protein DXV76_12620 [Rhodobacteraceae bacterium CCMM004]|nr:hypothetical protein DXV76_12620 [Rhodobacteraceae bacterium CCMM004]